MNEMLGSVINVKTADSHVRPKSIKIPEYDSIILIASDVVSGDLFILWFLRIVWRIRTRIIMTYIITLKISMMKTGSKKAARKGIMSLMKQLINKILIKYNENTLPLTIQTGFHFHISKYKNQCQLLM